MKAGKKGKAGKKRQGSMKEMRPPGGRGGRGAARQVGTQPVGAAGRKYTSPQSYEVKRRAVQLHLEEGAPINLIAREIGVSAGPIYDWLKQYKTHGEEGLRPKPSGVKAGYKHPVQSPLRRLIHDQIVTLKREQPAFGVKRIAHTLRRLFHLPTSPETVRKTLHREKLIKPRKKKTHSNPSKPRFFERSTPNQMWQSDIFPFKLGGEAVRPPEWLGPGGYAYLIGFIDDHSRYITALEVFRSQTADNLMEVFRRGVGAHGVPKEMLTDNGRQYASWHGKTKFQQELARNRIQHIRSRPHHPQTLGKIERFWKTIWEEFISRARFATFEEARERIRWWVQYYNHQRPHQALDGLCPADRFYRIEQTMRSEIEKGIVANVRELALHGKPQQPFYMVGRVGTQEVLITADQGQLKVSMEKNEGGGHGIKQPEGTESTAGNQCAGEGPSGIGGVERAANNLPDLQGTGIELGVAEELGEKSPGWDAQGTGGRSLAGADAGGTGKPAGEPAGGDASDSNQASPCSAGAIGGNGSSVKEIQKQKGTTYDDNRDEAQIQRPGTMPGVTAGMVGTPDTGGSESGVEDQRRAAGVMAGAGSGRDADGAGTAGRSQGSGTGSGALRPGEENAGKEDGGTRGAGPYAWPVGSPAQQTIASGVAADYGRIKADEGNRGGAPGKDPADHASADRRNESRGGGASTAGLPQDVLSALPAGNCGDGRGAEATIGGPPGEGQTAGGGISSGGEWPTPEGEPGVAADRAHPGVAASSAG